MASCPGKENDNRSCQSLAAEYHQLPVLMSGSQQVKPGTSGSERLEKLLDILPSFALLAGLRLDLFSLLENAPATAAELAERLGADRRRLDQLLYALAAVDLLATEKPAAPGKPGPGEPRFSNSPEASRFLVPGKGEYLAGHQELLAMLWDAALKTADSIRAGRPLAEKDFAAMSGEELSTFLGGLHSNALQRGRELAGSGWLGGCRRVADIGSGSGGLLIALAGELPELRAVAVELPRVAEVTRGFVSRSPVAGRIDVAAADLTAESPVISETDRSRLAPGSFDAVLMVSFLQVLSPGQARRVVARAAGLLRPGGALHVIGAGILDDGRTTPAKGALFNLAFLNIYEEGRSYTAGEHRHWLRQGRSGRPRTARAGRRHPGHQRSQALIPGGAHAANSHL